MHPTTEPDTPDWLAAIEARLERRQKLGIEDPALLHDIERLLAEVARLRAEVNRVRSLLGESDDDVSEYCKIALAERFLSEALGGGA